MKIYSNKKQENKSQSVANIPSQKQNGDKSTFQFIDNRPEVIAQRKLQEMANESFQIKKDTNEVTQLMKIRIGQDEVKDVFDTETSQLSSITERQIQTVVKAIGKKVQDNGESSLEPGAAAIWGKHKPVQVTEAGGGVTATAGRGLDEQTEHAQQHEDGGLTGDQAYGKFLMIDGNWNQMHRWPINPEFRQLAKQTALALEKITYLPGLSDGNKDSIGRKVKRIQGRFGHQGSCDQFTVTPQDVLGRLQHYIDTAVATLEQEREKKAAEDKKHYDDDEY